MFGKLHSWLKTFFILSKSEQRGIVILIVVIITIGSINFFIPHLENSDLNNAIIANRETVNEFLAEQKRIDDSVNLSKSIHENKPGNLSVKLSPFDFNPNNLPENEWKKLGFSDHQIKNIKNFESAGGRFRSKEDLKKIYTISDDEFDIIEPYIKIPDEKPQITTAKNRVLNYKTVCVNSADKSELQNSIHTPEYLTERILSYRDLLGGYVSTDQLREVYGLNDSNYIIIEQYILIDTSEVKKFDINSVEFKELLKHPYFDYNTTVAIFNTRNKVQGFDNLDQVRMISKIEDSLANKIIPYLYIRENNDRD